MPNFSIEYGWGDGQPWVALITRDRTDPFEWTWRVYGLSFTPWPDVAIEEETTSFVSVQLPGES